MQLSYAEDLEDAQARLRAYWANECLDRPALCVTAPRDRPLPGPPAPTPPADLLERWTNCAYRIESADAGLRATFHGGEAIPSFWPNLGPGSTATFFGSEPVFDEETAWFRPVESDWTRYSIEFDADSPWWKLAQRMTREAQEAFAGKALVAITDLGGATDSLDSLRDTPGLLVDMLDPGLRGPICRARDLIVSEWQQCYDELFRLVEGPELGSIQWAGIWGPGKMYTLQSDVSCMISAEMFEWFVVPEIEALSQFLDQCIYHLDGRGALRQLDRLLEVPSVQAVQWVPGAGAPSIVHWIPTLKRIQAAGKALQLHEDARHVETLVRELKPEGLLITTQTETEEEARELVRMVGQWCGAR